jgi:hypothetical protein
MPTVGVVAPDHLANRSAHQLGGLEQGAGIEQIGCLRTCPFLQQADDALAGGQIAGVGDESFEAHPDRFTHERPSVAMPPASVSINPVQRDDDDPSPYSVVNFPRLSAVSNTAAKSTLIFKIRLNQVDRFRSRCPYYGRCVC